MESTSQSPLPKEIRVKILLAGGHEYTVALSPDAPLLHSLIAALVSRAHGQEKSSTGLFQIPIEQGRSALCFVSEQLVGLVTEPPVFVQQNQTAQPQTEPPVQSWANLVQKPTSPRIIPSEYVQIDNFLGTEETSRLLNFVLNKEKAFVPTSTSTNDINYRRSMALYDFPEFSELIVERIQKVIPDVLHKLGLPLFAVSQIEAQLTAHNDGNYYKIHNDNGSTDTATRELTYVYYFYQTPKPFRGGELRIYDSKIENSFFVGAETFKTVDPRNNSIVFFLSRCLHEVLSVHCPSQAFADSRFTINGWVRR
ncbi:2OG-Fe(II) oxygenase [Leptolyngbya sp. FACHB-541]|uniref:2OG-Fe(II) oxygenase n=1 Tax=Leptolyngbya sp. FACHB-541 TaxID=2692810 RepID=UPI00168A3E4E|nr:2OG-Fe(II) oxygenase [Leptolyngbya sp. FACHB-541]MBD1995569.1 2OG-Fe(II) oxygenase [Leptolyngbya sp. FACHB-541]